MKSLKLIYASYIGSSFKHINDKPNNPYVVVKEDETTIWITTPSTADRVFGYLKEHIGTYLLPI